MKRVIGMIIGLIFVLCPVRAQAQDLTKEIPEAYVERYGDVGEEVFYDELELLAHVVYWEAANQDIYGKRLVADVVLNRMNSQSIFKDANTIKDVIYQKNQFSTAHLIGRPVDDRIEECYEVVQDEIVHEANPFILFFSSEGYLPYGDPSFKFQDHYFNTLLLG